MHATSSKVELRSTVDASVDVQAGVKGMSKRSEFIPCIHIFFNNTGVVTIIILYSPGHCIFRQIRL